MQYLIGTDEAGYGPNLGPLTISVSVWRAPVGIDGEDLYRRLEDVIVRTPREVAAAAMARLAVADSKKLYSPGKGLRHLERALWAAMAVLGRRPETWSAVWDALDPEAGDRLQKIPWYADYDSPVPIDAERDELASLTAALADGLAAAGVELIDLRSRAVFPEEFNDLLVHYGTKGAALSHLTLGLAARAIEPLGAAPVAVVCDKHGGRNRYAELLAEHFPDPLIEIHGEGRQRSIYRFGPSDRRIEFRFCTKAESYMPVALASMASKYLRELAMRAFNAFWSSHVPDLRPTAGYPADAKRFKRDIAAAQEQLGVAEEVLWRVK
ncbi:MAG: hypothetical protein HQ567_29775 [Candidatus Nealsonbacteria bacterium]|nr:hypothetical protein [Candidatus Nealsonbacteria bacterium]